MEAADLSRARYSAEDEILLVLNEATAYADMDTDNLIQQMAKFSGCTVLKVVLLLDMIIDSDC